MPILSTPALAFVDAAVQNKVVATCDVAFTADEVRRLDSLLNDLRRRFPNVFPQSGGSRVTFLGLFAATTLRVIRVIPRPIVVGSPPPPLPPPITLQRVTAEVKPPVSVGAGTKKIKTSFTITLGLDEFLITDHLHATVELYARVQIGQQQRQMLLENKLSNDLVLTLTDLARLQPGGVVLS